jgi:hypothetical protein
MKLTIESTEHKEYRIGYQRVITIHIASDDLTADEVVAELLVPAMAAFGFMEDTINAALAGYVEEFQCDRVMDGADAPGD